MLFILSGPSGVGKSTIIQELLKRRVDLRLCVSCTTRPPRKGEVEARDYFFIDPLNFQKRIQQNDFLEWVVSFDHYYGTPLSEIEHNTLNNLISLLDIDWKGYIKINQQRDHLLLKNIAMTSIFINPPSLEILEDRLKKRNLDTLEVIQKRLASAQEYISKAPLYDHRVTNTTLETCVSNILQIIEHA